MAEEGNEEKKEARKNDGRNQRQMGESRVGLIGIILITVYLILLTLLLLHGLGQFWPEGTESGKSDVTFLFWTFSVSGEVRLLILIAFAGALGGLVRALRSLYWYIGNRDLRWSWLPMYILLPFVGTTLGLVFYFVIRGGFFSPQATVEQTSPFGFVALASLVGLFTEQAVLKLKEVAETLLAKPQQGKDHIPSSK